MIKYVPILLRIQYKKIRTGLIWWWLCDFFSDFLFKSICCGYSFKLHRQVDAIQMSTHNLCLYKEVKKKRTLAVIWRLQNDCALIGVCAVIRSNMVIVLILGIVLLLLHQIILELQNLFSKTKTNKKNSHYLKLCFYHLITRGQRKYQD